MSITRATDKVTIPQLHDMRERGDRITMVVAYDYPSGRLADEAGMDVILVGDSLAMTMLGHPDTLRVTMDEMLVFTRAVSRACSRALVIGDMPYGSYTVNSDDAIRNALRFIKEAGADAVKLEGGATVAPIVRRMVEAGVPVMGHIGLTPQSLTALGGFRVQGRTAAGAQRLARDAQALAEAGAFALVVEAVPAVVGQAITAVVDVPTLGIGAGPHCSGQVLLWHDLFGLYHGTSPKFVRRYGEAGQLIASGLAAYVADVRTGQFPTAEHTYAVPAGERAAMEQALVEIQRERNGSAAKTDPAAPIPALP